MMRPIFFLFFFLLFGLGAFGQTFTINALTDTLTQGQNKICLASKGFILCAECPGEGNPTTYIKNRNKDIEESLSFYKASFEYSSKNAAFIDALLGQAKATLKLISTHQNDADADHLSYTSYQFTNGEKRISFLVFKTGWIISVGD